jgi:hypothetical protein
MKDEALIVGYFGLGTGGGMLLVSGVLAWQIVGALLLLCSFGILCYLFR